MTKVERAPKLYVTSDLVEKAQGEGVAGVTAHSSAQEVIRRGGEGRLDGLSVSRLILHTSASISEDTLRVFSVPSRQQPGDHFVVSDHPGTHPHELIRDSLPEIHPLIVQVKEFDVKTVAWGLHNAAARYSQCLPSSTSGERQRRAQTERFGEPVVDDLLDRALTSLGGSLSQLQPTSRREPEAITERLRETINPFIGVIRAVQNLGTESSPQEQSLVQPFTPAEMAQLIEQNPPIVFYSNEQ